MVLSNCHLRQKSSSWDQVLVTHFYTGEVHSSPVVGSLGLLMGLLCGSFLNVCIDRLPRGESVVSPGSHCDNCGRHIRWFDNVPLLSFFLLRGKCRYCEAAIRWRHPAVELATGIWFLLGALPLSQGVFWTDAAFRLVIHQAAFCSLGFFLIGLAVTDWQHQRLPNALVFPGMALGFFLVCTDAMFLGENDYNLVLQRKINLNAAGSGRSTGNIFLTGPEHLVYGRLLAVVSCFLLLFTIRGVYRAVRKRDGMGLGDAKLLAMIASFAGFAPAMLSFFLGTLFASVYGLVLLGRRRASGLTRLPFGSFLAVGGLLAALTGESLLNWYLHLF
ncbi:MAG: prepilin peptidase [Janthinobacterium lividum]